MEFLLHIDEYKLTYEGDAMFKIAICDDDINYRTRVKNLIVKITDFCPDIFFYEYSSGEELIKDVNQMHNLLFLDIQMGEMDGNETAKVFRKLNRDAILIFCTNFQNPTPESFKVQPYRYIMKDLQDQMLKEEMPDIIREMERKTEIRYLNVTEDGNLSRIPVKQILYVSVVKRGALIHQYSENGTKEICCRETVKEIYDRLLYEGFEYAHNSYIVNMANIIHVSKNVITLKDKTELNISRSKQKNFDSSFSKFLRLRYKRK